MKDLITRLWSELSDSRKLLLAAALLILLGLLSLTSCTRSVIRFRGQGELEYEYRGQNFGEMNDVASGNIQALLFLTPALLSIDGERKKEKSKRSLRKQKRLPKAPASPLRRLLGKMISALQNCLGFQVQGDNVLLYFDFDGYSTFVGDFGEYSLGYSFHSPCVDVFYVTVPFENLYSLLLRMQNSDGMRKSDDSGQSQV